MDGPYCIYYTAHVPRKTAWFVSGVFRNESNLVLERCINRLDSEFEFFVPKDMHEKFLQVAQYLVDNGFMQDLCLRPNRIEGLNLS